VVLSSFGGGLFERASRDSRLGALSFLGLLSHVSPSAMDTCFPCGMFLHCASNADDLYVNAKESFGRECRFSARRRLSPSH
jgi:hypothetical protein